MESENLSKKSSDSWKREAANLSGFEEFRLLTLLGRTADAQAPNPILGDPYAQETLDRCIFKQDHRLFTHSDDHRWVRYSCNRAKTIDKWCQQFLDNHTEEKVQVLNLCCGLDSRNLRTRWGENVRWVDVDVPNVVDLRNRVMPSPQGNYSLRSLSITTDGWFKDIPADRKTIIICECYLYWVDAGKVKRLFRDLVDYFGAGQFIFDTIGMLTKKHEPDALKKSPLAVKWAIDDVREIEKFHPKLKLTGRVRWPEYLGNELPMGQNLPPVFGPWTTALLSFKNHSSFKDCLQVARFDFGDRAISVNSSDFTDISQQDEAKSVSEKPEAA